MLSQSIPIDSAPVGRHKITLFPEGLRAFRASEEPRPVVAHHRRHLFPESGNQAAAEGAGGMEHDGDQAGGEAYEGIPER